MKSEIMMITPEIAGDWLARNTRNRRMKDAWVKELAAMITAEDWVLNGESIIIAEDGTLVDGQHRLAAIVMADKPIESMVVTGAPADGYETVDVGKRRGFADKLYVDREYNYAMLSAVTRWQWQFDNEIMHRSPGSLHPSHAQLARTLERHPELRAAVTREAEIGGVFRWMPGSLATFLYHKFSEEDEDAALQFFSSVAMGTGLRENDPRLALRERLIANRSNAAKLNHSHIAALTIKAWNAYRAGDDLKVLMWRNESPFPVIGKDSSGIRYQRNLRKVANSTEVTADA